MIVSAVVADVVGMKERGGSVSSPQCLTLTRTHLNWDPTSLGLNVNLWREHSTSHRLRTSCSHSRWQALRWMN